MAIKGKRKSRPRSGRVVTPGPRPAYVPPKVPLFQRTGAKFTVALLIEAAIFSLLVGFGEQSERERQQDAISQFSTLVDTSLSSAGPAIQLLPGSAQVLPELGPRLTELIGAQEPDTGTLATDAEGWSSALTEAAGGISEVEVPTEALDPTQTMQLTDARAEMDRGLRLFAGLADQVLVATRLEGQELEDLLSSIQSLLSTANSSFSSGYAKLQLVRTEAGLPTSTPPTAPGGLTGIPEVVPPELDIPVEEPADGAGGGGGGGKGGGKNG